MKKDLFYLCTASLFACAGASFNAAAAEASAPTEKPEPPNYRPWTVGFEGGSQGLLGGFVSWRFSDHLGTRFAGDYTKWTDSDYVIKDIHYDVKLRLLVEPLTLDVYPWQKSSFRFSLGMVFNQNQVTGTANNAGSIIIDGQPLDGTLSLKIKQQPVNPYVAIGGNFFHFDHAQHWAIGGELGVAYAGESKVSLTRTGPPGPLIDAAVSHTQDRIKSFADQFKWWPVVKLYISYSF